MNVVMGEGGSGWYWAIKPESDTQSTSHALARAIVAWNLRNAFDQHGVSVWVLFWTTPWDKTATREVKGRTGGGGSRQGLPDEYINVYHTLQIVGHWPESAFSPRRIQA